jgi:hypothetical protein
MSEKLVVSYSALAAFKNCPKSYEIEYDWKRQSNHENEAIKRGSTFHSYLEQAAKGFDLETVESDNNNEMFNIASDYIQARGVPSNIKHVEESFYYEILSGVEFRVTPDLVYEKDSTTLICRDWKTFSKRPPMDIHISDQARFYIVVLEALNPGYTVEFEFEYVRSERIGVPRPRSPAWSAQDSYFTVPYTLSPLQKEGTWRDLEEAIMSLVDAKERKAWYRTGRMGFGIGTCTGCLQKPLCNEEWEHGFVSQERLEALSTQREVPVREEET